MFEPGDVIEIRALDVGRNGEHAGSTRAGYFNFESERDISVAVRSLEGRAEGVYVILNQLNPDLLSRSANRLRVKPKNTTTDADIIQWRWLYIDADACRPAGISATDAEHATALQKVIAVRDFLSERGWPDPILGDSGNGGHLLYRLPPLEIEVAGDLVKRCLKALSTLFSDAHVKVDESTATPARLCKLYGTMACKGDSTVERPHRRSHLIETPERIEYVAVEHLEGLAAQVPKQPPTTVRVVKGKSAIDVDLWLATNGLEILKGPESYQDGRRWTFPTCFFNPEHEKPVLIQYASGVVIYKCLHKSCGENGWNALRLRLEPGYQASPQSDTTESSAGGLITDLSQIPSVFTIESKLDWCIEGMIAQGSVTLICAESGTGKTWLGYYLAGCVAHGKPVLGRPIRPGRVLYLDGENPLYVAKQRFHDLGITDTLNLIVWGGWNNSRPVGPNHSLIVEFARQHRGVIIYDSLIEFHSGSEQSSTETRAFMRHFRALADLGATVIVLHHSGKSETAKLYRGSSDIKAAVDTAYALVRTSEEAVELAGLSMTCFKARLAPGQAFGMKFVKGQGFVASDDYKRAATTEEVITDILAANPGLNQSEIVGFAKAHGCTRTQVENCLKSGGWSTTKGDKNATLYSLPQNTVEVEPVLV